MGGTLSAIALVGKNRRPDQRSGSRFGHGGRDSAPGTRDLGPLPRLAVLQRGGRLLFPSPWTAKELMIGDVRNLLDRVVRRAGLEPGEIWTKAFRHTYCAARPQTLDQGAPVSTYTVDRELGHESESMVRRVYAHLGAIRHRSEVVEYRVEQPRAAR